jgi:hemolysin III
MSNTALKARPKPTQRRRPTTGPNIASLSNASRAQPKAGLPRTKERQAERIAQAILKGPPAWYRSNEYELVNAITHGTGLALALAGALVMGIVVANSGDTWRIIGCTVFAASMIAVYAASTLSHS